METASISFDTSGNRPGGIRFPLAVIGSSLSGETESGWRRGSEGGGTRVRDQEARPVENLNM
ncbi:hypothetical protein EYF80_041744 [Liparis tanakae]|uniref:Uncharacterized protein n=1 Tax=Liparis tanakae TaxID=230148 RepID=A0A4Z2G3E2_9TELE|nr:hypothetical protein EYF80_041744 [Liparis tanakae]